jgi:diguanylate cyclase (GGDEF)-like protein
VSTSGGSDFGAERHSGNAHGYRADCLNRGDDRRETLCQRAGNGMENFPIRTGSFPDPRLRSRVGPGAVALDGEGVVAHELDSTNGTSERRWADIRSRACSLHRDSAVVQEGRAQTKRPYLIVLSGAHVGELHGLTRPSVIIGRGTKADLRIVDEGVSRAHVQITIGGRDVSARDLGSLNGTFHNGRRAAFCKLTEGDKLTLGAMTVLKLSFQDVLDEQFQRDLYAAAVRDSTTRAMRTEFFLERLQAEVLYAVQKRVPLTLMTWDIDDLDRVDNLYGRAAGDRVLATIAQAVAAATDPEDVLGRLSRRRFAMMRPGTTSNAVHLTAERFRRLVACTPVRLDHASVNVTASFGVAVCPTPGISGAFDLLCAAEGAMYRAKDAGKNRISSAE